MILIWHKQNRISQKLCWVHPTQAYQQIFDLIHPLDPPLSLRKILVGTRLRAPCVPTLLPPLFPFRANRPEGLTKVISECWQLRGPQIRVQVRRSLHGFLAQRLDWIGDENIFLALPIGQMCIRLLCSIYFEKTLKRDTWGKQRVGIFYLLDSQILIRLEKTLIERWSKTKDFVRDWLWRETGLEVTLSVADKDLQL